MEKLKEKFRKNGINYKLIERTDKVAIYELTIDRTVVGYEVARIVIQKESVFMNRKYSEKEILPSNERFGYEGSKAFFAGDFIRANEYFAQLTLNLQKTN